MVRRYPYLVGRGNVLADQTASEPGRTEYDDIVRSGFSRARGPTHGTISTQTPDKNRSDIKNLEDKNQSGDARENFASSAVQ